MARGLVGGSLQKGERVNLDEIGKCLRIFRYLKPSYKPTGTWKLREDSKSRGPARQYYPVLQYTPYIITNQIPEIEP